MKQTKTIFLISKIREKANKFILAELGLVKKFQAAEDSRVIYVELTEQGKALQKLFEKISADLVQKVFQNMEQEEMKKLEISLQKILDNLG